MEERTVETHYECRVSVMFLYGVNRGPEKDYLGDDSGTGMKGRD